jgi:hypothetical protein
VSLLCAVRGQDTKERLSLRQSDSDLPTKTKAISNRSNKNRLGDLSVAMVRSAVRNSRSLAEKARKSSLASTYPFEVGDFPKQKR